MPEVAPLAGALGAVLADPEPDVVGEGLMLDDGDVVLVTVFGAPLGDPQAGAPLEPGGPELPLRPGSGVTVGVGVGVGDVEPAGEVEAAGEDDALTGVVDGDELGEALDLGAGDVVHAAGERVADPPVLLPLPLPLLPLPDEPA